MKNKMVIFGDHIKSKRIKLNLSLRKASKLWHIGRATLKKIEEGKLKNPSISLIVRLSTGTKTSPLKLCKIILQDLGGNLSWWEKI